MKNMNLTIAMLLLVPALIWLAGAVIREIRGATTPLPPATPSGAWTVPAFDLVTSLLMLIAGVATMVSYAPIGGVLVVLSGAAMGFGLRVQLDGGLGQKIGLLAMAALCAACTALTFAQFSLLSIFPGLTVAFSCGQLVGMLTRCLRLND